MVILLIKECVKIIKNILVNEGVNLKAKDDSKAK